MRLTPGTRLGPYEVLSTLGAGGMGEVYRARDTKLKRDVALKILPEQFIADPERLARFQREAEVLASLNHPNIAAVYGFDDSGAIRFLVMELVEGETLADRLAASAVPIAEAVSIARQIAEALQSAHELGIIHRDLKPANITVRPDGTVKVLDFGLAKALEPALAAGGDISMSPTITTPAMTQLGMILGTAAYMSPEQAKGRPADKRSDVWAFGCVLYEMLAGRRAFEGEDVSDTLANVLKVDPDWRALPDDVPSAIRILITRCLAKDRRQRIADMAVAQFILSEHAGPAPAQPSSAPAAKVAASKPRRALFAVAAVLVAALLAGAGLWRSRPPGSTPTVARFSITVPEGEQLTNRHVIALSPDGSHIAYVGSNRLFVRSLSEFDARVVPGTETHGNITSPAFSPDGLSIAFHSLASGAVQRVATGGGTPVSVCQAAPPSGMTWDSSGILIGQAGRGIVRCSPNGGAPEQLVRVNEGETAHGPQMLLDGAALLFTIAKVADGPARWDKGQIVVQSMTTKARKTVIEGGTDARYLPTGHLVYSLGGTVYAVPFDVSRQQVTGGAVPVIEGVRRPVTSTGAAQFATSTTGTLVYLPGPAGMATTERALALADRSGAITRLPVAPGPYVHVRASHDGARLAIGSDDGKEALVSILELTGTSAMRRLTFGGQNRFPIWSPDGQRVAFQSDREGDSGIFVQRADGNGPAERLTKATGEVHVPESWSPDGRYISYSVLKGVTLSLWLLSIADGKAMRYGGVESTEPIGSVFSPDGQWVAYSSTPTPTGGSSFSASRGVYIQPFPATGAYYQVPKREPQELGFHPVWGPRGTMLFYVPTAQSGQLAAVSVTRQPGVAFGTLATLPARVTAGRLSTETRAYDILPDGRFVGLVGASEAEPSPVAATGQLRVVLNWFEELKQRVP